MPETEMRKIRLLNDGYIDYVTHWGSDEAIVEAARMSTGKGFLGWGPKCRHCGMREYTAIGTGARCTRDPDPTIDRPEISEHEFVAGDEKLLGYLYENRHDTPFEMAGMTVEVQAPIIVFREWHRHRTFSYNEASARYAPLPALDYVPTLDRVMRGGGHLTKQAASAADAAALTEDVAERWLADLQDWQRAGEVLYQRGLRNGVPKELARLSMSVGRYSKMRAQANLRNWLHFLGLRRAPNAQEEIRVYADAAATMLRELFPRTMALYDRNAPALPGPTPAEPGDAPVANPG